ncbi:MAG TPA: amino acid permease [Gemmataceae bacterium]|jgi:amino acid transporter|nr:amino acid permease [Gemmataceae bacterium]
MDLPARESGGVTEDVRTLHALGYRQELWRRMSAFSNYAISLSIICILAGGVTSFHLGLCSVGGASIGLGWPLASLLALAFAATMGQLASAFPTAGGLYHWAAILGGRGWGWATAWFNLAGLITVLAAINVGTYLFVQGALGPWLGFNPAELSEARRMTIQIAGVLAITFSQAVFNHRGIKATTLLTDFSGYLILVVAVALTLAMLLYAPQYDWSRLIRFANYSGPAGADVWPRNHSLGWLFALGLLLPAYTITGFDASAHTAEETVGAAHAVPRCIIRAVWVSALFGWLMLCAVVLAIPNMDEAAAQGENAFLWITNGVLPAWLAGSLCGGIALAQYFCGLATVTSASRMVYAFARDGGLPFSRQLRAVNVSQRVPASAIWLVAVLAVGFTVFTPVYSTITTVCVIFLYISYLAPIMLGLFAYGRWWTRMGPWSLGGWYRWLAGVCLLGGISLLVIGVQPPNDKALWIVLSSALLLAVFWYSRARHHFQGPPQQVMLRQHEEESVAVQKENG